MQTDDFLETYELVKKFHGNPWDRVSQEIRRGAENFVRSKHAPSPPRRQIAESEFESYLSLVFSKEHAVEEVKAFLYSWEGSIDLQRKNGFQKLADEAFSSERFKEIWQRL